MICRMMPFRVLAAALVAATATPASAQSLTLDEFEWRRADVFCGLSRAEAAAPNGDTGRYVFVTALLDDPQVAIERGYARFGAEPEQLVFVDRRSTEHGEIRRYRSARTPGVEVTVDVTARTVNKQTVFEGELTARRGTDTFAVAVKGACR